jgi:hypothetical protein
MGKFGTRGILQMREGSGRVCRAAGSPREHSVRRAEQLHCSGQYYCLAKRVLDAHAADGFAWFERPAGEGVICVGQTVSQVG